jgi:hypothetical protein
MIPVLYLLGKWAYRGLRYQVDARRALLSGGEMPGKVANPFFEDSTAMKILTAVLATANPPAKVRNALIEAANGEGTGPGAGVMTSSAAS